MHLSFICHHQPWSSVLKSHSVYSRIKCERGRQKSGNNAVWTPSNISDYFCSVFVAQQHYYCRWTRRVCIRKWRKLQATAVLNDKLTARSIDIAVQKVDSQRDLNISKSLKSINKYEKSQKGPKISKRPKSIKKSQKSKDVKKSQKSQKVPNRPQKFEKV